MLFCFNPPPPKKRTVLLKYRLSFHLVRRNVFFSVWCKGQCRSFPQKTVVVFKIFPSSSFLLDQTPTFSFLCKTITNQIFHSSTLIFKQASSSEQYATQTSLIKNLLASAKKTPFDIKSSSLPVQPRNLAEYTNCQSAHQQNYSDLNKSNSIIKQTLTVLLHF